MGELSKTKIEGACLTQSLFCQNTFYNELSKKLFLEYFSSQKAFILYSYSLIIVSNQMNTTYFLGIHLTYQLTTKQLEN